MARRLRPPQWSGWRPPEHRDSGSGFWKAVAAASLAVALVAAAVALQTSRQADVALETLVLQLSVPDLARAGHALNRTDGVAAGNATLAFAATHDAIERVNRTVRLAYGDPDSPPPRRVAALEALSAAALGGGGLTDLESARLMPAGPPRLSLEAQDRLSAALTNMSAALRPLGEGGEVDGYAFWGAHQRALSALHDAHRARSWGEPRDAPAPPLHRDPDGRRPTATFESQPSPYDAVGLQRVTVRLEAQLTVVRGGEEVDVARYDGPGAPRLDVVVRLPDGEGGWRNVGHGAALVNRTNVTVEVPVDGRLGYGEPFQVRLVGDPQPLDREAWEEGRGVWARALNATVETTWLPL